MNGSIHHVGEWGLGTVVVVLPTGLVANVPFVARDEESASKCVRFSLWLLGVSFSRPQLQEGS